MINADSVLKLFELMGIKIPDNKKDEFMTQFELLFGGGEDDPESGSDTVSFSNSFKSASGDDKMLELDELKYQAEKMANKYTSQAEKDSLSPVVNLFMGSDNKIDEELFKKVAGEDGKISEQELMALDTDGDGKISQAEVDAYKAKGTTPPPNTPTTTPDDPTPPATGETDPETPPPTNNIGDPAPKPETKPAKNPDLESSYGIISNGDGKLTREELEFRVQLYQSGKLSEEEKAALKPLMDILLDANGKIDDKLFNKLAGKEGNITLAQIQALDTDGDGKITSDEIGTFKNPPVTDKDKENALKSGSVKTTIENADKFDELYKEAPASVVQDAKVIAAFNSIKNLRNLIEKLNAATTTDDLNGIVSQINTLSATIASAVTTLQTSINAEKSKQNTNPTGNFDSDFMTDIELDLDPKFTSTTNTSTIKYDKGKNGQVNAYSAIVDSAMNQIQQMNNQTITAALKTQFNYDSLSADEKKVVDQKIEMITKAAMFETLADMMSSESQGDFQEVGGKGKYAYQFEPKDLTDKYLKNIQKFAKQSDEPEKLYKVYQNAVSHFKPYMGKLDGNRNSNTKALLAEAREGAAAQEKRFPNFFTQNDEVNPMNKQYDTYADNQESILKNYSEMMNGVSNALRTSNNIPNKNEVMQKQHDFYTKMSQARQMIQEVKSADSTSGKKEKYDELIKLMDELRTLSYDLQRYQYMGGNNGGNGNYGYQYMQY